MKNYSQTKKSKENFKSYVLDYMMTDKEKAWDKYELAYHFNLDERTIRRELEEIANYYPVIATSNRKGYKVAYWNEQMTNKELESVDEEIMHQVAELNSRIKNLKARLKPLIANHKVIKKIKKDTALTTDQSE